MSATVAGCPSIVSSKSSFTAKMPKLFPEHQPRVTSGFVREILKLYGLELLDYDLAKSGIENTTIIAKTNSAKVVVRIYRQQKKSNEEITTELDFMEFLRTHGIPTTKVIRNISGAKISQVGSIGRLWQVILMEYIDGHHDVDFDREVIDQLARLQAKIHVLGEQFAEHRKGINIPFLRETIFHEHIQKDSIKSSDLRAFIDRIRNFEVALGPDLPRGWSHFDFDPDNILFDDEHAVRAILDFDDVGYMPLVVCLGYTLWDLFVDKRDSSKLKEYLSVYEAERPLSVEEKKLLPAIMLFRHYVVSSSDLSFGRYGAATEDEMLKQEKLLQQIAF